MMGRQVGEAQLFYIFSVDRHVPADHLLRRVDAYQGKDPEIALGSLAAFLEDKGEGDSDFAESRRRTPLDPARAAARAARAALTEARKAL